MICKKSNYANSITILEKKTRTKLKNWKIDRYWLTSLAKTADDGAEHVTDDRPKQEQDGDNNNGNQNQDQSVLNQTLTFFTG